jgi:histidinol-phosphate aminotransferase
MIPIKEHLKSLERIQNPMTRAGYLRLDKNENIIGFEKEFVANLRKQISSDFLTTYPEVEALYQKIARWIGCRRENIYITAGSDAAIKSTFEVFVEPGDKVALLSPTYAMFYVYTNMFQGQLIEIRYKEGLSLSAEDILKVLREQKPKLICIANPNSPTGTVLPQEDLNNIVDVAAGQNSLVLLDEAYYLFYPVSSIDLIYDYPNLVITRTFSKAMGLASARLGFAAGHADTIKYLQKVRPIYETNAFAIRFAELILDSSHLIEKNVREAMKGKQYLEDELDKLGIHHFKSYTNFILIDVGSFERSIQLGNALYQKKILIRSGFKDDVLKNCIRVTTGSIKQMEFFMEKFKEAFYSLEENLNHMRGT